MRTFLVIPCLLALVLCGCPSGFTGIYDAPVKWLGVNAVAVPEGPLVAGGAAEFSVTWHDGRAPYTVVWEFVDGATPTAPGMTTSDLSHAVTVNLVNSTAAAVEYDGYVTITDASDDAQSATFRFTVNPAS